MDLYPYFSHFLMDFCETQYRCPKDVNALICGSWNSVQWEPHFIQGDE